MDAQKTDLTGLVADIGGTNVRFAIARITGATVTLDHVLTLPGKDYPSVEQAAADYLARIGNPRLDAAAAACAGPIVDGAVAFTNVPWSTTETRFGAAIGLHRVLLLNDLAAVAWAAPALDSPSLRPIAQPGTQPGAPAPGPATRAILNAGTGCNASAFIHTATGEAVAVGEYGHASFAPVDDLEIAIWRLLHAEFGRVSIERVLCGPGLLNLYRALCAIAGAAPRYATPADVTTAAQAGDATAHDAVTRFCALMGSVAGDVALCFGARGGVFLAGGVAATLLTPSLDAIFRDRFEDKGRFKPYLAAIPTAVITAPHVALRGAARAMAAEEARKAGAPPLPSLLPPPPSQAPPYTH